MGTVRYPAGFSVSDRPDNRGYWRLRGPSCDRRFSTLQEAEQEAWRLAQEALKDGDAEAEPEDSPTISHLIEMYLDGAGRGRPLATNTVRTMRSNLRRHVQPLVGDVPCAAWDQATTMKVIRACEESGLADSSIGKVIRDLSAVARIGRQLDLLHPTQEPCKGLNRNQPSAMLRSSLPGPDAIADQANALVEVSGQQWRSLQVMLLAYSGLRSCELLALQPRDIDNGVVRIERQLTPHGLTLPKHRKQRETIYPMWLDDELQAHLETRSEPDVPLFPGISGDYEAYGTFLRSRWQPASHRAGWTKLPSGRFKWTAHTLRHYFGTWAISPNGLGLDIADVSMFMGHSSPDVTHRLYVSSRPDRFERARAASLEAGR